MCARIPDLRKKQRACEERIPLGVWMAVRKRKYMCMYIYIYMCVSEKKFPMCVCVWVGVSVDPLCQDFDLIEYHLRAGRRKLSVVAAEGTVGATALHFSGAPK